MTRLPAPVRVAVALAFAAALWVAGTHVAGLDPGLLCLAPAFLVALPLLAGRYPAESMLSCGPRRPAPRRAGPDSVVVRAPVRLLPRGGLLVGHALAGRAPPA